MFTHRRNLSLQSLRTSAYYTSIQDNNEEGKKAQSKTAKQEEIINILDNSYTIQEAFDKAITPDGSLSELKASKWFKTESSTALEISLARSQMYIICQICKIANGKNPPVSFKVIEGFIKAMCASSNISDIKSLQIKNINHAEKYFKEFIDLNSDKKIASDKQKYDLSKLRNNFNLIEQNADHDAIIKIFKESENTQKAFERVLVLNSSLKNCKSPKNPTMEILTRPQMFAICRLYEEETLKLLTSLDQFDKLNEFFRTKCSLSTDPYICHMQFMHLRSSKRYFEEYVNADNDKPRLNGQQFDISKIKSTFTKGVNPPSEGSQSQSGTPYSAW